MYGQGDWNGGWQCYDCSAMLVADRDRIQGDNSAWAVGIDHNFSKRTKAYVLYTAIDAKTSQTYEEAWGDRDADRLNAYGAKQKLNYDQGGFSIGMIHSF
jgi:predicted porin